MNPSNHESKQTRGESSATSEYKKDKRHEGKFNIVIGILFLIWTGVDVISGLYDSWYSQVPFALIGCAFLIYGVIQLRSQERNS